MLQLTKYLVYLCCDLGNPYFITGKSNQFYLGICNNKIKEYYAEPMRTKSQAFNIFQKFIYQAKCQLNKKLKYLYIDFKTKFANKTFEKYIVKKVVK